MEIKTRALMLTALLLSVLSCGGLVPASAVAHEGAGRPHYYQARKPGASTQTDWEVAVYGGTPAGVTAAIQSARMGKRTVLLSFNGHVGGMTSGGLTATDVGEKESIGGLAAEFYRRVGSISDFSPSGAEALCLKMLAEAGVTVRFHQHLESTEVVSARIRSIRMLGGDLLAAKMFVDATYEGDLLAAANVSYRVGREPADAFGESLAGQWQEVSWRGVYQFCDLPISPFVVPGDQSSGLLPEIASEPPGEPGQGDHRVQAYNFRMHLSNSSDRVPFPRPRGYDPERFALLARLMALDPPVEWTLNYTTRPMTDGPVQMRNGDSNNAGSLSSDYVGGSHRWPDGTYERGSHAVLPVPRRGLAMPMEDLYQLREELFQEHVDYQQGLMYFLAHDSAVPRALRMRVDEFGLDPDEFKETGHWPHQLYVREGRRMVSSYVMTQANCQAREVVEDSIGLGSYAMDSHFCQRVVLEVDGQLTVRNEGGFGLGCPGPYPISYRSIVPAKSECENLLVPVCLSASHVAYGSIRMEPVFMILGQSAGAAASLALDGGFAVQDLPYAELRRRLVAEEQRL